MFHIMPIEDWIEHQQEDCPCEPDIFFVDPLDGEVLEEPLVIHKSLSGEHSEIEYRGKIYG